MAALPDVPRLVRDAVFVSVGLGLLGVNQLQVRRRELAADLRRLASSGPLSVVLGNDSGAGGAGGADGGSAERDGERDGGPAAAR